MIHIRRVEIENFQSHQHSVLEFGPGLNVITGPSDSGKSAILRALRWALYGEPRGSEFVRAGARECRVTVDMSSGVRIVREQLLSKSAARNRYHLQQPGAEPQVFEGFGTEVPREVVQAHGMPQVLLDTDRRVVLNFGAQLEGPFLTGETGFVRARAIGRLLGVHVVDAAARAAQRDLRASRQDGARLERELERYESELAAYADVPARELAVARAAELLDRVDQLSARLQRLEGIQQALEHTDGEEILTVARLSRLALPAAEERARLAQERSARLVLLARQQAALRDLEQRAAETRAAAEQEGERFALLLAEYEAALRQLGRCPTCLQPVEPEAIRSMIAELSGGPASGHPHS